MQRRRVSSDRESHRCYGSLATTPKIPAPLPLTLRRWALLRQSGKEGESKPKPFMPGEMSRSAHVHAPWHCYVERLLQARMHREQ